MTKSAQAAGRLKLTSWEIFLAGTACYHYVLLSHLFIDAGAIAKTAATIFTYPVQLAQSRLRATRNAKGEEKKEEAYKNTLDVLVKVFRYAAPFQRFSPSAASLRLGRTAYLAGLPD